MAGPRAWISVPESRHTCSSATLMAAMGFEDRLSSCQQPPSVRGQSVPENAGFGTLCLLLNPVGRWM